ncbi:TetR/AcrR family transcriptional regulator [Tomitella fengzijianii]|uniref:TetR/AcrR family transcriptional regulator n=1 Tax=Tomitella fengzijianii TaxID=2597660 RepID=A0A516X0R9_9ACTN|nr:TetR/AcrR family transcriptional regulator [Tomitella fengzijianii]QDQ96672.1 TetR/AcrR family transcriptional regulator [Tomitella fengzijianii]
MVRQERAEATRRQILDAAAEIFAENGYIKANLGDIVSRADVTKGALYFHFDSKESLAREIVDERDRRIAGTRRAIEASSIPPVESMIQQSMAIASLMYSDLYVRSGDMLLQELGAAWNGASSSPGAAYRRIHELLESAVARGDVRVDDTEVLAKVLWSQFWGARMTMRMLEDGPDLITCLEHIWLMTIDSVVIDEMRGYFRQVVNRAAEMQRSKITESV